MKRGLETGTTNFDGRPTKKFAAGGKSRCRHWARGNCQLGETCNFAHTGNAGEATGEATGAGPSPRGRSVCRHWARGYCQIGDTCNFSHTGNAGDGAGLGYGGVPAAPYNPYGSAPTGFPNVGFPNGVGGFQTDGVGFPGEVSNRFPPQDIFDPTFRMNAPNFPIAIPPAFPSNVTRAKPGASRCRHWAKGYCQMGDRCAFSHSGRAGQEVQACRHWTRGFCQLGARCNFAHEGSPGSQNSTESKSVTASAPRCRHYARGNCYMENCRFAHTGEAGQELVQEVSETVPAEETDS